MDALQVFILVFRMRLRWMKMEKLISMSNVNKSSVDNKEEGEMISDDMLDVTILSVAPVELLMDEQRIYCNTIVHELVLIQYAIAQCYYAMRRFSHAMILIDIVLENRGKIIELQQLHSGANANGLAANDSIVSNTGDLQMGSSSSPVELPINGTDYPDEDNEIGISSPTNPNDPINEPMEGIYNSITSTAKDSTVSVSNTKVDPDYTAALNLKFLLLIELDQWETAQVLGNELRKLREILCGIGHNAYAIILNNLGVLQYTKRDLAKAGVILDNSLEVRERNLGTAAEDTLLAMNNMATLLWEQGSETEAKEMRAKMLKITSFKKSFVKASNV